VIESLQLDNFKSWRHVGPMRLAPLTGLFGTNSSGKTSLMQFLLMLKQTADSPDRNLVLDLGDARSLVELGTFRDVVHQHDVAQPLQWRLNWRLRERMAIVDPASRRRAAPLEGDAIEYAASVRWEKNGSSTSGRMAVAHMAYGLAGTEFGMRPVADHPGEYELFSTPGRFTFKRVKGRAWPLPQPAKCYGFPDQVRAYFQNAAFLSDFELAFERLAASLYYLGPLREYPKREYAWGGSQPTDVGRRGERVVEALLASRDQGVLYSFGKGKRRKTLDEVVAMWLKELGLIDSFEVRPIVSGGKLFQVWVRRQPGAQEVLLTDVGFGVSQILPVIALCYYAPEGTTLLLEQPEIHLHPAVQAGLADVLIEAVKSRNVQIIVESHSEHLLRRLQRRVAEERLLPEDTALYFCGIKAGISELTELKVDLYGNIENWPEGFFGDDFGEIAETQKAILRRRGALAK
jgi:predicted ATPase